MKDILNRMNDEDSEEEDQPNEIKALKDMKVKIPLKIIKQPEIIKDTEEELKLVKQRTD